MESTSGSRRNNFEPNSATEISPRYQRPQNKGYIAIILAGIIIILVGGIINTASGFFDDPMQPDRDDFDQTEDYDKAYREYQLDYEDYKDGVRVINTIGEIIQYIGVISFSFGMVIGALRDKELSPYARLGMLLSMGIVLGLMISGSITYYYLR